MMDDKTVSEEIISFSTEETVAVGHRLAMRLIGGEIIALSGELGAGKTQFVKGIGSGLGIAGVISSPTFVVTQLYTKGRLPLIHMDLYRIDSFESVEEMGWYDFIDMKGVIVIEWAEKIKDFLSFDDTIFVDIKFTEPGGRKIKITTDPNLGYIFSGLY